MLKKIFIGSLALFIVLLISWGVYFISFRDTVDPDIIVVDPEETKAIVTNITKTIDRVIEIPMVSPELNATGSGILFFQKDTGMLYDLALEGQSKDLIFDVGFPGIVTAIWSKNKKQAMIKTDTGNGSRYWFYDTNNKKPTPFKDNITYLTWDSLGEKAAYIYRDPETGQRSVNTSHPYLSSWDELTKIEDAHTILAGVPFSPYISYWPAPANTTPSDLKLVNILTRETKTIFTGKLGADYLWSPDGKKVLVSSAPNKSGSEILLAVMNNNGGQYLTLSNSPTLVSKCVWSYDNIHVYCALPTSLPNNTVMPDDYNKRKVYTIDSFWKINTTDGTTQRIVEMSEIKISFDATDLFLSLDEDALFFLNRKDSILYKIKL